MAYSCIVVVHKKFSSFCGKVLHIHAIYIQASFIYQVLKGNMKTS